MPIPECGGMIPASFMPILDNGGTIPFFLTGTDPHVGVVDGSALAADYTPPAGHLGLDKTFMICIEVAAPIVVQLQSGEDFTITTVSGNSISGSMVSC